LRGSAVTEVPSAVPEYQSISPDLRMSAANLNSGPPTPESLCIRRLGCNRLTPDFKPWLDRRVATSGNW